VSGPLTYRPFAKLVVDAEVEVWHVDTTRFERGERLWAQFIGHRPECERHTDGVPHNPCWAWTNVEPPSEPGGASLTIVSVDHGTGTVTLNTKGTDE
jgi:hypothetical protein